MSFNPDETLFEGVKPDQLDGVLALVSRIIRRKGGASDWTLQKTYYLACVESIEDRLVSMPAPRFFSWNYGPWSKDLRAFMEALGSVGQVRIDLVRSTHQDVTRIYKWPAEAELPQIPNPDDDSFVDGFLARVGALNGELLTTLAKRTVPYAKTLPWHPIDLDGYLAERRSAIERLSDDATLAELLATRTR